jgi:hypothetical protein
VSGDEVGAGIASPTASAASSCWTRSLVVLRRLGRHQARAVLLMGLVGLLGSSLFGMLRGPPLPRIHDEFSYLLGADTFAEGRLTNPTHPHWEHFETFHVIHTPTYQSKYPPAQAGLLAFGQRYLGHPAFGLWLGSGLLAASLTWALLAWLPSHWAMMAALLGTAQLTWVSPWAQSYWGGAVAATGGALTVGAFRRLWCRPTLGSGLALGLGLGVMALSRPFEGALLGLGVMGALAVRMFRRRPRANRGRLLRSGFIPAMAVAGVALAIQATYNHAVTGSATTMPYQVDSRLYAAAPVFIFSSLEAAPSYRHAVMEEFWMSWGRDRFVDRREPIAVLRGLPGRIAGLAIFFLGPGLVAFLGLGAAPRSRWSLGAAALLATVLGGGLLTVASYPHYVAPAAAIFFILMGSGLVGLHRRGRRRGRLNLGLPIVLGMVVVQAVAVVTFLRSGDGEFAQARSDVQARLERHPESHLVLVHYRPGHNVHEEWVYNRADIDGSSVVWARSMSREKDRELVAYFGDRQVWHLEVRGSEYALRSAGELGEGES